ncbi:MAG: helix-turn-helix transcriptional regulator [Pyrinomonadaceae bacterium]
MTNKKMLLLKEKILAEIKKPPTVEELAVWANVSPSRLRQIFKQETGMPFVTYTRHLQLERARESLETTLDNIQQISVAVGFHDQSYFNRLFKEKYGLTPIEYRDNNHQDLKKLMEKSQRPIN